MNKILLAGLATLVMSVSLQGQDFTNLNFEAAKIVFVSNSVVDVVASDALPGWSVYFGTNQLSTVQYNDFDNISVRPSPGLVGSNLWAIGGNFSAVVGGSVSISQTALIPAGDQSLLFDVANPNSLTVTLGGQSLSYTPISSGTTSYYSTYAANISAFAGQVETLTFSGGYGILDDIQFSPGIIPEPSTAALVFLGSGILFYVRKRSRFRF